MGWLTDNIRWVHSVTLEGDRLTADGIAMRRDRLVGARLDRMGVRLSFVAAAFVLFLCGAFSVGVFLNTLQFFQPDYTVLALSLVPIPGLAFLAFQLRPRRHLTLLLADGSALGVLSSDAGFQARCLEAFERLWSEPDKSIASLYIHGASRSVTFGPPTTARIDVAANPKSESEGLSLPLPIFNEGEGEPEAPKEQAEAQKPVPVKSAADQPDADPVSDDTEVFLPPALPSGDDWQQDVPAFEDADLLEPGDMLDLLLEKDQQEAVQHVAEQSELGNDDTDALLRALIDDPESGTVAQSETAGGETADAHIEVVEAPAIEAEDVDVDETLTAETPEIFDVWAPPEQVPASVFAELRPKIEALVRLLRERSNERLITDSVDILDLMTRRGCSHPREVRALTRSIDALGERMQAYPTAIDLLNEISRAGQLTPNGQHL